MNTFVLFLLIGLGAGLVLFPIFLSIYLKIKSAKERRGIKKLIKAGKFLTPIDPRDYDVQAWQNQAYGNINPEDNTETLKNLNLKIFKTQVIPKLEIKASEEEKPLTEEEKLIIKSKDYAVKARVAGYTDVKIRETFKQNKYSEELINKIMQNG